VWCGRGGATLKLPYATTVVLGVLLSSATPKIASACSCIHGTAKEERKLAETVFLGEIIDMQDSDDEAYPRRVTLRVERYWKGKKRPREIQVLAGAWATGTCATPLALGRNLVYAYRRDGVLVTWTCSRTKSEELAAEEMKGLGRWQEPQ